MSREHLSIGQAAEASGLTVTTIRYYEGIGLIPQARRGNRAARTGGNRLYDADDLRRLRFIRTGRLLGLGLEDIGEMLALAEGSGCPGARPEYREKLKGHLRTIDERIGHLLGLKAAIQELLSAGSLAGRCGCMGRPAAADATAEGSAPTDLGGGTRADGRQPVRGGGQGSQPS
jgi:MerR family copper efflux transcriptional regulator